MPSTTPPPKFRRLSEREIHDRLYGQYHADGRRRSAGNYEAPTPIPHVTPAPVLPPSPVAAKPPVPAAPVESAWTGQEILTKELERLSAELSMLRQEKNALADELLRRRAKPLSHPEPSTASSRPRFAAAPRSWVTVGGLLVVSAAVAALCHTVVLEAQPPLVGHSLPGHIYTVQAGVYDVKILADRFLDTLSREGYPAFLAREDTRRGAPRYRVYVGRYTSKMEAQVQLDLLKRNRRLQDGFVLQRKP